MSSDRVRDTGPERSDAWGGPFLTTVVWLPRDIAERARDATSGLRERWPEHFHYPADRMHVTVADLSALLGQPVVSTASIETTLAAHGPIEVTLRGLGVSPSTVFARAVVSPEFHALRRRLRTSVPPREDSASPLTDAAFANVVRFRADVAHALRRDVAGLGDVDLGTFTARTVDVLRTDKVGTPSATTVLARCALSAQPDGR